MDADETIQDACDLALEDGGREGWIRQWKELLQAVEEVIVYCAGPDCGLSTRTARLLEDLGYRNVREYPGGKSDWREAGYWFETGMPAFSRAG